jgi:hypothetical protein
MQVPLLGSDLPTYIRDPRRMQSLYPGQLLYSTKFDNDKLSCFYLWLCQLCNRDLAASRTLMDIYSNAVILNTPSICCCCCVRDNSAVLFFDKKAFAQPPMVGGICAPFPYCCTAGCFGCCGEGVVLRGPMIGCPQMEGHMFAACAGCICPINSVIGMPQGEAAATASILNGALARFRNAGNKGTEAMMPMMMVAPQPVMMMAPVQPVMMASPQMVTL